MEHAKYAVWYRGGPIAWFIDASDALDFIQSQRFQDQYELRPI